MKHASGWTLARIGKTLLTLIAAAIGAAVLMNSSCNLTNKAPTVPVITGPSSGVVGVAVTFKATATDPDDDSVAFGFDWSDSSGPAWTGFVASGETLSVSRTFTDSGTFTVRVKAKDNKGKASDWCSPESLHVINIVRDYPDSVYAEIPTANGGRAGAITPDGKYLYVAHGSDNRKVTPIRLADRTALLPITFDVDPNDVVSSVDGSHMYVTLEDADEVAAIRTSDNTVDHLVPVAHRPIYMAASPDGQYLLVTGAEPDEVLFLRTSDLSIADTVYAGVSPFHIVTDQAGVSAYVDSYGGVRVLDLATHLVVDSLTTVPTSAQLGLSRDGRFLYVSSWDDTGFVVVRLPDRTVMERLNVRDQSIGAFASTANDEYLMFSYLRGVKYVDTRTYSVVDSLVLTGENRRALVMHPTADTMYMIGYNKVYVIGPRQ